MPEFVGFQTMGILVSFDAVGVFGLVFHPLFKSCSTYYAGRARTKPTSSKFKKVVVILIIQVVQLMKKILITKVVMFF